MIRHATLEDSLILARHNQAMAIETENRELPDEIIVPGVEAVLADPNKGFYLVNEEEGQVNGNLMVTYEWSDWRNGTIWWIQSVYVRPEARGRGIFGGLFRRVQGMAKAMGVKEIRLYADLGNASAHEVYLKLGMHRSHYQMFEMLP